MSTPNTPTPTLSDRMKTVKAAWDKAPSGPQKDAAHVPSNRRDQHLNRRQL